MMKATKVRSSELCPKVKLSAFWIGAHTYIVLGVSCDLCVAILP